MQYNGAVNLSRLRDALLFAVLVTSGLAIYSGAFRGGFQYDDYFAILLNPHLEGWRTFVHDLDHMVRPLLQATFLLDRSLYGNSPAGYHLLNLILHFASTVLVYRILTVAVAEKSLAILWWTAVVFFVHPITTETVTYISGRASGLMAFFYLLAFFLYIEAAKRHDNGPVRRLYLAGAVVSHLFSFGSKETAMTFPLVLLLWDVVIRRHDAVSLRRSFLTNHLPFWIVLLAVASWAWNHPRYATLAEFSFTLRPLWDNFLSEIHAVAYAVVLFLCPWKLNIDHDLPEFHSPAQWPLPLDVCLLAGLVTAGLVAVRRLPLFSFGIGWFFVLLLPTSLIPRADLLSERNLYPAFLGLALAIVVFGSRFVEWLMTLLGRARLVRLSANGLAIGLLLMLCFFTYERNALYRSEVSLWGDAVQKSPTKARPHNNLGHAYAMQGEWDRAIEEFRIAAQLDPEYALARKNLRDAYLHVVGRN